MAALAALDLGEDAPADSDARVEFGRAADAPYQ